MTTHGTGARELGWFADHPCPADTIGVNYYATSDRMLDHRLELYPGDSHGGNGRHHYADVAAVHAATPRPPDIAAELQRAWRAYDRPVAITEAHIGCTREEQLRWWVDVWRGARRGSTSRECSTSGVRRRDARHCLAPPSCGAAVTGPLNASP